MQDDPPLGRLVTRYPWANTILLLLILAQLATGFGGLISGSENLRPVLWLHAIGAYAILVVLRWKGAVILHSFSRGPRAILPRVGFSVLTGLLLAILATGLYWVYFGRILLLGFSLLTIHTALAIAVLLFFGWHVVWMRFIFGVRGALGRRALLRFGGGTLAGLVLWQSADLVTNALGLPGARRRFTGSYETASFTGAFPTVSWLFDDPAPVDHSGWRLVLDGAVERPLALTYQQLTELAADHLTATIDCTGGWYSRQTWQGAMVGRLLGLAQPKASARSVVFEAVSGYSRRFSLAEARGLLLAIQVGDEPLGHGHGFPARLVAPDHRGYDWVKWVTGIHVVESGWFWQPPLPLQ